jgi:hypothetical protein
MERSRSRRRVVATTSSSLESSLESAEKSLEMERRRAEADGEARSSLRRAASGTPLEATAEAMVRCEKCLDSDGSVWGFKC